MQPFVLRSSDVAKPAVRRLIALGATALVLAAGLCLFAPDHGAAGDLCASLLALASGLLFALALPLAGGSIAAPAAAYLAYPPDRPCPPPRA